MADPVRLALIGAGRMGRMHLQAIAESDEVRVVALVDPSTEARAASEVDRRPPGYGSLHEALEGESAADGGGALEAEAHGKTDHEGAVEAVLIAAPTPLHGSLVAACAERGLPILCEKPCGFTTDEIDAAAAAARDAGVLLQIGYRRRYVPELAALREELQEGRLGALLQITCSQWDEEPPGLGFRRSSGGIAVDMGVHELDQIRWLTGRDIERAGAVAVAGHVEDDVDCATMTYELVGGGVGVVSLGRYFPHGDCVWVDVMGTRGYSRVDVLWGKSGKTWHPALRAQAEDFARCVRSGATPAGASAQDARRTLQLAAQARERMQQAAR
jgi:myo-inositol 2-dehydrogenase/D-chiro-inositol 1-dehydrogenase